MGWTWCKEVVIGPRGIVCYDRVSVITLLYSASYLILKPLALLQTSRWLRSICWMIQGQMAGWQKIDKFI